MLIDWFTVLAQTINFLILVFLLKRFLYGPITQAMDEREAKIAANWVKAEDKAAEAGRAAENYQQQIRDLARQREQMMQEARQESEATRKELTQKVRREMAETRQQWYQALQEEKDSFIKDLRALASAKIFAMARHVLKGLANADLEKQVIETFISRLEDLDRETLQALSASLKEAEGGVFIQSAFPIPEGLRQRLAGTVHQQIGERAPVRFEVVPGLIGGIAIKGYSYESSWNLDSYWQELEANLEAALEQELAGKSLEKVNTGSGA